MDLDPSTFDEMTPEEFVRIVSSMSDREIVATMSGEHRIAILDEVFSRFPVLFRPEKAQGVRQVTQFRVTGGPAARPDDTYEIVIDGGECWLAEQPGADYDVSLMLGPVELTKMITGRGNPTMLVMRGKIKVRGDLARAASFSSYFDVPKG